ncbi:NAD(P)/FAD-dependent oxidoreductase [Streptacidiphilus sp. EB129]|jgi:glycine/D-amino acid oxidase-like deaminating enzyme|uniref:NAD(P)/FAD-dependent oxidoreductase n=1 Tax=Streptacidiphilus sp. EB129 TaxID=3156262 RepID=UPI003511AB8E
MRIGIVGSGVAGALLAWQLRTRTSQVSTDLYVGELRSGYDATGASGGMVRGFDPDLTAARQASESLAEIRSSSTLREWSDYREIGSVYLLPEGSEIGSALKYVDTFLPGSAEVVDRDRLTADYPFRGLPDGVLGVTERQAGFISPARLRNALLSELTAAGGVTVLWGRVSAVTEAPAVRLAGGSVNEYDAVILATGAWTPQLLEASNLPEAALRTKVIQYTVCTLRLPGLGVFVDETTGMYGRPLDADTFLLGLPGNQWGIDPDTVSVDSALAERVVACGRSRFSGEAAARITAVRSVTAFDCYHDDPGLALRPVGDGNTLFTFTGGGGGAAKTAFVASRQAADALLAVRT